jgi:hypothetical protein
MKTFTSIGSYVTRYRHVNSSNDTLLTTFWMELLRLRCALVRPDVEKPQLRLKNESAVLDMELELNE